ncbi:MAG: hypothetical protein U0T11_06220 [Chitinophagaceae bacterium]
MQKFYSIALTAIITLSFYNRSLAQTNFSGTWVLNMEKSKLEDKSEGFTGSTFVIQQQGSQLRLTRTHFYGSKKKKLSFKMKADGKTRRIKLLFNGKLEQTPAGLKATLWRKNFSNIVEYQFGNSNNEFIADEVMKSKYSNHHNIWVFDREIVLKDGQ